MAGGERTNSAIHDIEAIPQPAHDEYACRRFCSARRHDAQEICFLPVRLSSGHCPR